VPKVLLDAIHPPPQSRHKPSNRCADITVLVDLLKRTIDDARYPLSPRVTRLREVLAKLRPEPVREPMAPRKVYGPPRAMLARRRRAGR
jgi:hypothetical protein